MDSKQTLSLKIRNMYLKAQSKNQQSIHDNLMCIPIMHKEIRSIGALIVVEQGSHFIVSVVDSMQFTYSKLWKIL